MAVPVCQDVFCVGRRCHGPQGRRHRPAHSTHMGESRIHDEWWATQLLEAFESIEAGETQANGRVEKPKKKKASLAEWQDY